MDQSQIGTADFPFASAEDWLHERARAATGLEDFGGPEYLEGLRRWLESLDDDADLSAAEQAMLAFNTARPAQPHAYAPEQFGLTAEAIRSRFASYIDTAEVRLE